MSLHIVHTVKAEGESNPDQAAPDPARIMRRVVLRLGVADEGLSLDLPLERVCLCCVGNGFLPVTISESCSNCAGLGYEFIDCTRQPCSVCDGSCWVPVEDTEQCERCRGMGLELTDAGRALLAGASVLWEFLERWRERWRDCDSRRSPDQQTEGGPRENTRCEDLRHRPHRSIT